MNVKGMTCQGCVKQITKSLVSVEGVSDVVVSLEDGTAQVAYDTDKVKPEALTAAVVKAGFKAELAQVDAELNKDENIAKAGKSISCDSKITL